MNPLWSELCANADVSMDEARGALFGRYLDLLTEANARMNLTRITDRSAAELNHVADALTLLPLIPKGTAKLIDVGSGGGVPGIPLAIALPETTVTLVEATKKKAVFLRDACRELGLTNVIVVDERAEDTGAVGSMLRDAFDVATVRAVATMPWLVEWCLPLVRKGGKLLCMKGPRVMDELPEAKYALKQCNGGQPIIHPVTLPGTENRLIVEIEKLGRTDARYPRKATLAKGKPLS